MPNTKPRSIRYFYFSFRAWFKRGMKNKSINLNATWYKLLITDDDLHLRKLVRTYAELEGFQCKEAENAQQALDIIHETDFDLSLQNFKPSNFGNF